LLIDGRLMRPVATQPQLSEQSVTIAIESAKALASLPLIIGQLLALQACPQEAFRAWPFFAPSHAGRLCVIIGTFGPFGTAVFVQKRDFPGKDDRIESLTSSTSATARK